MDTRTSIDAEERERELVITRIFDAPRHLFQAWTEPTRAARWWEATGLHNNLLQYGCPPGQRLSRLHALTRGRRAIEAGVYREVVEPERLVFTFAWEDPRPGTGSYSATGIE
jgi:uncharacterized protein YndB with AHSA1/START domain